MPKQFAMKQTPNIHTLCYDIQFYGPYNESNHRVIRKNNPPTKRVEMNVAYVCVCVFCARAKQRAICHNANGEQWKIYMKMLELFCNWALSTLTMEEELFPNVKNRRRIPYLYVQRNDEYQMFQNYCFSFCCIRIHLFYNIFLVFFHLSYA